MLAPHVIGVDFGTDSVRAVIVDATTGSEVASSVVDYPRWKAGLYCDPSTSRYRQHPLDYIEGMERATIQCLDKAGEKVRNNIAAISIDTTGSTPVLVDRTGTPLALRDPFADNPNAMFVLWKDHTATTEAEQINAYNATSHVDHLKYVGGIYSSEWYWAKLLHILREDAEVRSEAYTFVEHCDWIPFLLTGQQNADHIKRGVCSAGHKALWSAAWNGFPPNAFFKNIDPLLDGFVSRLHTGVYTADQAGGTLSPQWAERLGLSTTVVIGIGAFDAHMGAVGGQIEPYFLSKVMGTSTCDMMVAPAAEMGDKVIRGICGQVDGSIIPGMIGMEAGQSAFGDAYAWFKKLLEWPLQSITDNRLRNNISNELIPALSVAAANIPVLPNDELAIDWFNGRRTPDANQRLKGALMELNLATDAPRLFKAIVESTCFGARTIIERFGQQQVPVRGLIGLGGVAKKSPYVMQTLADVTGMDIRVHRSEQTCAVGAAMFAAVAGGIYGNVQQAMQAMGAGFEKTYHPNPERNKVYAQRYQKYVQAGSMIEHNNDDELT